MMSDAKQAIHVIAEAIAKPGQEDALYRTLHACVAPTPLNPATAAISCIRIWIMQPGSSFTRLG
jgi:alpha-D-ribose 1-methylphosphonate 5-triphosphate synthase subunit PhnH